jgi:hypothetical protein
VIRTQELAFRRIKFAVNSIVCQEKKLVNLLWLKGILPCGAPKWERLIVVVGWNCVAQGQFLQNLDKCLHLNAIGSLTKISVMGLADSRYRPRSRPRRQEFENPSSLFQALSEGPATADLQQTDNMVNREDCGGDKHHLCRAWLFARNMGILTLQGGGIGQMFNWSRENLGEVLMWVSGLRKCSPCPAHSQPTPCRRGPGQCA